VLAGMKRAGIDTQSPDALLISHLHGDHFAGLPFLLLEYRFVNRRTRPFVVAAPPTAEQRIADLNRAMYKDLRDQCNSFPTEYRTIQPGTRFDLAGFDVEAFLVQHTAEPFCLGYRIRAGGATLLFSGDSAWTEAFVPMSKGTDVFLCECCTMEPDAPLHTSYRDILAHRKELGCKRLVLTHLGEDVRASPDVDVERAFDGMVIEIGR
jgi:ribonuclease BN (tRNA processing enzyme)